MNYTEALDYILSLSDFERRRQTTGVAPAPFSLDRIRRLCAALGDPQNAYLSIHLAGTKGKGSTAANLHGITMAAGLKTALYTSPHLHDFRERIRINNELIAPGELADLTAELRQTTEALQREEAELGEFSTFEFVTALAFLHFARQEVEMTVLETGLGGRLDATNVVTPLVSVITSISRDHVGVLGDTLTAIAGEKAGIIKPGVPVVSQPQVDEVVAVLERVCRERGCRLYLGGRDWRWRTEEDGSLTVEGWFGSVEALRPTLQGEHQQQNAACAVAVALLLAASHGWEVGDEAVARGLNGVVWPGRLELLRRRPAVVVDGAHNGDSAQRLAQALRSRDWRYRRLWLVLGLSGDKDADAILAPLAPLASRVIATRSHHPRSLAVEQLAERCRGYGAVVSTSVSVADALAQAIARADEADLICATGSLFVVAEAREALGRG